MAGYDAVPPLGLGSAFQEEVVPGRRSDACAEAAEAQRLLGEELTTLIDGLLRQHHDRLADRLERRLERHLAAAGPRIVAQPSKPSVESAAAAKRQKSLRFAKDHSQTSSRLANAQEEPAGAPSGAPLPGSPPEHADSAQERKTSEGLSDHGDLPPRGRADSGQDGKTSEGLSDRGDMPPSERSCSTQDRHASVSSEAEADGQRGGRGGRGGGLRASLQSLFSMRESVVHMATRMSLISSFSRSEQLKRNMSLYQGRSFVATESTRSLTTIPQGLQVVLHSLSRRVHHHISTNWFEVFLTFLIISSAIFCGIEVEYMAQMRSSETPKEFHYINLVYTVVFAVELFLRVLAEGWSFCWWPNWRWNLFDTLIVLISILEVSVSTGVTSAFNMQNIRVIRMVRIVRVLRIVRIMKHFRSLRILIHSVLNTLRSLFWTLVLLTGIIYTFGILFTQATTDYLLLPDSRKIRGLEATYGTVGQSILTLFKAISGGVSWEEVLQPLGDLHSIWVCFFLVYFAFTYFAVLNVVTGVFCQTAIESAGHDQEMAAQAQMAAKQEYIRKLQVLFQKINVENTGMITLMEFEDKLRDEQVRAYFASIDLSIDEAFSLFKLLDQDNHHVLDVEAFVTGCLKLRGAAKSIDIAMMMYETRWKMQKCLQSIKAMEGEFQTFRSTVTVAPFFPNHLDSEEERRDERRETMIL